MALEMTSSRASVDAALESCSRATQSDASAAGVGRRGSGVAPGADGTLGLHGSVAHGTASIAAGSAAEVLVLLLAHTRLAGRASSGLGRLDETFPVELADLLGGLVGRLEVVLRLGALFARDELLTRLRVVHDVARLELSCVNDVALGIHQNCH
jgi:hypothetical protein